MQVSWIEPDQLRDLVGQLQRPPETVKSAAVELHTLPNESGYGARELGIEEGDLWLPDQLSPSGEVPAPPISPPQEELFSQVQPAPVQEPPAMPESIPASPPEQPAELNRVREKLRAIRERAIEAGLLAHVGVTSEVRVEEETPTPLADDPVVSQVVAEEPPPELVADPPQNLLPVASPFSLAEPAAGPVEVADATVDAVSGFLAPPGTLSDRLDAFAGWACRQLGLKDLLIVDDHGDILWGIHEQAGLIVSAMMACKAALRSSALGASGMPDVIEHPVSIDRMLVIVPCETGYGTLSLAFVHEGSFPSSSAELLKEALRLSIETPSTSMPPEQPKGNAFE